MSSLEIWTDADGTWVRDTDGELMGPYDSERAAAADLQTKREEEDAARAAAHADGQQWDNLPQGARDYYYRVAAEEES